MSSDWLFLLDSEWLIPPGSNIMYQFLREEAKKNANIGAIDYTTIFADKSALEILRMMVGGYFNMNQQEHMLNFYKVIYSERSLNPMAARIVAEETDWIKQFSIR